MKSAERIAKLAAEEQRLVAANNNGYLDVQLYRLRKELDTLRLRQKGKPNVADKITAECRASKWSGSAFAPSVNPKEK